MGEQKDVEDLQLEMDNVTVEYSCSNYWSLKVGPRGIMFITFSDLISSGFFSQTSLLGFYAGVAYLVGQTLRKIAMYNTDRIFICDIPNSDSIRNIIQCIYLQRLEQNLKK